MTVNARQEPSENKNQHKENIAKSSSLQERKISVQPAKAGITSAGWRMNPTLKPQGATGK